MAEIRLICPGCAAEYRLTDTAIPLQGREVECSACGHVWHAVPSSSRLTLADALPPVPALPTARQPGSGPIRPTSPVGDAPLLSRPLPSSVLDILRDEVEHERRARAAETAGKETDVTPRSAPDGKRGTADPDWPATTITRHIDPKPTVTAPASARAADPSEGVAPATRPAIRQTSANAPRPVPVPAADQWRYAAGFGLSVMLAAVGVALYAMAPALADHGSIGEAVVQTRAAVDALRLWLQDRVDLLMR